MRRVSLPGRWEIGDLELVEGGVSGGVVEVDANEAAVGVEVEDDAVADLLRLGGGGVGGVDVQRVGVGVAVQLHFGFVGPV